MCQILWGRGASKGIKMNRNVNPGFEGFALEAGKKKMPFSSVVSTITEVLM